MFRIVLYGVPYCIPVLYVMFMKIYSAVWMEVEWLVKYMQPSVCCSGRSICL